MRNLIKAGFARQTLVLTFTIFVLTVLGRAVAVTNAEAYCPGWPWCVPTGEVGWLKLAHILLAGTAAFMVLLVVRKAWHEHSDHQILLPLTTVMAVLFYGQVFTGAIQVLRSYPDHLVILHGLSAVMLWISLIAVVIVAASMTSEHKDIKKNRRIDRRQRFKDFTSLTKPLIIGLLLVTTYGGLIAGNKGWPSPSLTFWTLFAGALAAGGSSALNQYIDRELDKRMQRTAKRPLADGRLTSAEGLAFGLGLCLVSYYIMAGMVNFLAALLSLSGIIYYVLFYSLWLKKATVQNIVVGGGAGAIPPMVGWAAATGTLSLGAWILFAIVFFWTPPHFWALAITRTKDYQRAGVPMLPAVKGELITRRMIFIYTIELVAVTLLLPVLKLAGSVYFISALALGCGLIYAAWGVWKMGGNKVAWKMYRWSSMYLLFIFIAIAVDVLV